MIKIISEGKVPPPKRYAVACPVCNTRFEYDIQDTNVFKHPNMYSKAAGVAFVETNIISCPLKGCNTQIVHHEHNALKDGQKAG